MNWIDGPVYDCRVTPLHKFVDERGWLAEVFRQDNLDAMHHPVMAYLSLTHPGIARGPHEHVRQTDLFVFFSGLFRLYLWDARAASPSYGHRHVIDLGETSPASVLVPPGVVHAYRNVGTRDALILNCPNALYAGQGKAAPVDEIRHEDRADHLFMMS